MFVCCAFASYLTGLSSMMLIWTEKARCKWRAYFHNRISSGLNQIVAGESLSWLERLMWKCNKNWQLKSLQIMTVKCTQVFFESPNSLFTQCFVFFFCFRCSLMRSSSVFINVLSYGFKVKEIMVNEMMTKHYIID